MTPTQEQLNKLPRWAQDHIRDLERQRKYAVDALNGAVNGSKDDSVWYYQTPCTGEDRGPSFKRFNVPSHSVHFSLVPGLDGADVDVTVRNFETHPRISITFSNDVYALIPSSGNCISLDVRPSDRYREIVTRAMGKGE